MVRALCTLSMVLPPVVGGVALFFALGRRGIVGQYLDRWFDIRLPFTTAGVVVAQTFVAMPFLVITVEAALRQLDTRFDDASRTLGASSWYTFRRVTLPAIRPALVAGAVLSWARALGEFGATITFAGNFPGTHADDATRRVPRTRDATPRRRSCSPCVLTAISFAVLVAPARPLARRRPRAAAVVVGVTLSAEIGLRLGTLELGVELEVAPGELLALLGPNGAGKSTVLRCLAGLDPIDSGRIDDRRGRRRRARRAERSSIRSDRPIGFVFQDYLLFAHMTVLENVAFGLRARKTPKDEARAHGARVGRTGRARRVRRRTPARRCQAARPSAPRSPAPSPPIPGCCCSTSRWRRSTPARAASVRRDLRRHLETFDGMRILVTHDPVDAYALADRVAILDAGRIVQVGTLPEVTAHPRSRYVADLVGVNLVSGERRRRRARAPAPGARVVIADAPSGAVVRCDPAAFDRDRAHRTRRARALATSGRARSTDVDRLGDRVRVGIDGVLPLTAEITAPRSTRWRLRPGDEIYASVKATDIEVYPA